MTDYLASIADGLGFCAKAGFVVGAVTCAIAATVAAVNNLDHEKGTRSNALMILKKAAWATVACAVVITFVP